MGEECRVQDGTDERDCNARMLECNGGEIMSVYRKELTARDCNTNENNRVTPILYYIMIVTDF